MNKKFNMLILCDSYAEHNEFFQEQLEEFTILGYNSRIINLCENVNMEELHALSRSVKSVALAYSSKTPMGFWTEAMIPLEYAADTGKEVRIWRLLYDSRICDYNILGESDETITFSNNAFALLKGDAIGFV